MSIMTSRFLRSVAVAAGLMLPAIAAAQPPRVFQTPEEAVTALRTAARAKDIQPLLALLGARGRDLASSSDAATARQHRAVFLVAMREGWKLADVSADRKELVVGREEWPFPVPLVKTAKGWVFDAAAGKEEVITRRIGRNELAAIQIVKTYVAAQRAYAKRGHDAIPAGAYARRLASTAGTEDGLYWPVKSGEPHSPLGPLVAEAAAEGRTLGAGGQPTPFHGYYFRILEKQGAGAQGGARSYVVGGAMTGGFALVAWPAAYGNTGVMTFIVGPDGTTYEHDLGANTASAVKAITAFNPDNTWHNVVAAEQP
ncbi:hypothetical protein LuPra_02223 [Luteitalea pratensis]|uniref:DUF2950 domain-containing protein n=2 Tax=Luteitalea pratensis TaxID=1855912 RepID=A0A143PML5_LUTPR|nr:hypothetical protein LuPra_02223 [Luteitalea pratensis]